MNEITTELFKEPVEVPATEPAKPPKNKRQITQDEIDAISGLQRVTFPVASWDKRFYNNVLTLAKESGFIGEKSAPQLWRILVVS